MDYQPRYWRDQDKKLEHHAAEEGVLNPERSMTKEELKQELQHAGKGHIQTAAKELKVDPLRLRDWIGGKEPVPEEIAERVRSLPSRKKRPPR